MSPRRKLSETRRFQILEAAVTVIGRRGLCETRVADIAERAGASSALVLYYFGSKDRLLAEALNFSEERFYADVAEELASIPSARDRLVRLIDLSCAPGSDLSDHWEDEWVLWLDLWARAARDGDVARDREKLDARWRTTIAEIVRSGQDAGEFGPVDPEDFAIRLGALVDGLAVQVVLGDATVTNARMREMCLRTAATELGFGMPPVARAGRRAPAAARRPVASGHGRRSAAGGGAGKR